jgi:hypothetical protein
MGGILEVCEVSGFLGGRERLHAEADNATKEWAALCAAWWSSYEVRPVTAKDLFAVAKDHALLLDVWAGRTHQGALQRIGHALAARRDRVFGDYKIVTAGRDGVTRNAAYRLEERGPDKTPETPETPEQATETPSQTQNTGRVFWAESQAKHPEMPQNTRKTPAKHPQNTRSTNNVQDDKKPTSPGVSGVSGVLNRPHPPEIIAEDDDREEFEL